VPGAGAMVLVPMPMSRDSSSLCLCPNAKVVTEGSVYQQHGTSKVITHQIGGWVFIQLYLFFVKIHIPTELSADLALGLTGSTGGSSAG
jgi:hypothetical protein